MNTDSVLQDSGFRDGKTVFPQPGLSEAFFEAALATDGEAVHMKIDMD